MTDTSAQLDALFSPDYDTARARFMLAAAEAGATLSQYVAAHVRGPRGSTLSCDVAVLGPRSARKAFVAVAGTHGVEGYAGSAAHLLVLRNALAERLAPDCRIVLIHAINPYGFAHDSRTNENNVDLNRNFIDHDAPPPDNPVYAQLHDLVCPLEYSEADQRKRMEALHAWTRQHGAEARNQGLIAGQYSHPGGKSFGGRQRAWSNRTLERIARTQLQGVEKVAFIDWHTGLGRYGEEFFLCFNAPASPEYHQCTQWWGAERLQAAHGFDGASRPAYRGLLFHGLQGFLSPARFAGAVVEFGILPNEEQEGIFMLDHWLRFGHHAGVSPETLARVRHRVREAFTPAAPAWRASVAVRMQAILESALAGLAQWS